MVCVDAAYKQHGQQAGNFHSGSPFSADDHDRLLLLAASHKRSAATEIRWAVRKWLVEHVPEVAIAGQA